MATKEIINIPEIDANKALTMLGNDFPFSLEVDRKNRLVVTGKVVKVFIKFKQIGQSTEIKFAGSRWVNVAKVMFIPFYWIFANIQALDEHKSLVKEVANSLRHPKATISSDDISIKLTKLKEMKEQGIISEIIDSSNSENSAKEENATEKPKKKHKFIKILLICILGFFGFCFICSLFDDENASQAQDTKVEKTEDGKNKDKSSKEKGIEDKTKEKSTNKIGKWYALSDDFEIKITSLNQENYYQYADYVIKPKDENTYISVYFSYRNVSSVPVLHLTVASNEFNKFYLQSPEGKKYDLDVWGSAALFYETLSFTEKLDWALNDGSFNKGFLKPYSENLESGKNGFAIEVPKNKVQEKGWKLIVNNLEFSVSL